jgi:hypothetical protein
MSGRVYRPITADCSLINGFSGTDLARRSPFSMSASGRADFAVKLWIRPVDN